MEKKKKKKEKKKKEKKKKEIFKTLLSLNRKKGWRKSHVLSIRSDVSTNNK
jgi:hypothetical protein